jgi:ATP-dependent Clp protease adaptor protein ClpS
MYKIQKIKSALDQDHQNDDGSLAIEQAKPKLKAPSMYQVIMYNDDYTPMEFVVEILESFFNLDREKSMQIMLAVHTEGQAVCGIFTRDIAETKVTQVNQYSTDNEHPLLCGLDQVD